MEVGLHVPGSAAGQRHGRPELAAAAAGGDPSQAGQVLVQPTPRTRRGSEIAKGGTVTLSRLTLLCVLCVLGGAARGNAQLRRPKADVTPLVAPASTHAGEVVRAALRVSLPEGLHTQSNKP